MSVRRIYDAQVNDRRSGGRSRKTRHFQVNQILESGQLKSQITEELE